MAVVLHRTRICIWLFLSCLSLVAQGFSVSPRPPILRDRSPSSASALNVRRYGPPIDDESSGAASPGASWPKPEDGSSAPSAALRQKTDALRTLIEKVRTVKEPEHIPSLLTRHVDFIFSFSAEELSEVLETIRDECRSGKAGDLNSPDAAMAPDELEAIIDLILSFAQDFCDQTVAMQEANRQLLGRIIKAMKGSEMEPPEAGAVRAPLPIHSSGRERKEDAFDRILLEERDNLTPGFVRHLEAECERIENAPGISPENMRMLEYLRTIQARVIDEMGRHLGEPAQVILQLLGYDEKSDRIAVLEAGLVVRGVDFASELLATTNEALDGFQTIPVPGGVDPELLERVQEIRDRTHRFIEEESELSFQ